MDYINEKTTVKNLITINNSLPEVGIDLVRNEIISGLTSEQKFISSKYFYDKKGSELFEEITRLEEYYPTRTEKSILQTAASELTNDLSNFTIIELGSGDNSKISILLKSISSEQLKTISYIPVDVSQSAIEKSASSLARKFPSIKIQAVVADFMHQLDLIPNAQKKLICFFGSTIGNLNRDQSESFMQNVSEIMNPGDILLLGLDMVKDIKTLENAYNDSKQITAAFNKNILNVINDLLETDFDPDLFEHEAFYNEEKYRIEMHLKAMKDMTVRSPHLKNEIYIWNGETIRTENSHKFTTDHILDLSITAGLKIKNIYSDSLQRFSLVKFVK